MKRIIPLLLIVLIFLCGCGADVSKVDLAEPITTSSKTETEQTKSKIENGIDIDLTLMSGTMVYSQVYDILYETEKYIGKTIKIKGPLYVYEDNKTGNKYFSVLISDATACCQNGIEFVPYEKLIYPDDFPEPNTEITIVGTINQYKEGEYTYTHLENSSMTIN